MTKCGTKGFTAPEVLEKRGADIKADIFSFGMFILMLGHTHDKKLMAEFNEYGM